MYNLISKRVELLNSSLISYSGLTVKAQLYNLNGKIIWEKSDKCDALSNTVSPMFEIVKPTGIYGAYFLKLTLFNKNVQLTDNIYWLTTKDKDYSQLEQLPATKPKTSLQLNKEGGNYTGTLELAAFDNISFFNRVKVFDKRTGKRILPVHYSDNYVTLMPGDKKIIKFEFSSSIDQQDVQVFLDSWTSDRMEISVKMNRSLREP
ncbi:MAG: hypothetical protein WC865_01480 [Bacteroidales bacterium]